MSEMQRVFEAIEDYVARATAPLHKTVVELQAQLTAIPRPQDGKSVTPEELRPMVEGEVARAVGQLPRPTNGKDADEAAITARLMDAIDGRFKALPAPKDGVDADENAVVGKVLARIPPTRDGVDGKDADEAAIVEKVLARIPTPKNGEDGEHGRDAIDIEFQPHIDTQRSYPAATYALHRGGIVKAMRTTDPLGEKDISDAGWRVIVEGVAGVENRWSDERTVELLVEQTSGVRRSITKRFAVPIYRGVHRKIPYQRGDIVYAGRSLWMATSDHDEKHIAPSKNITPGWINLTGYSSLRVNGLR